MDGHAQPKDSLPCATQLESYFMKLCVHPQSKVLTHHQVHPPPPTKRGSRAPISSANTELQEAAT